LSPAFAVCGPEAQIYGMSHPESSATDNDLADKSLAPFDPGDTAAWFGNEEEPRTSARVARRRRHGAAGPAAQSTIRPLTETITPKSTAFPT